MAEDDYTHQLFLGNPNGEFIDASERLPGKSEGNALAIGDVNGDGKDDIKNQLSDKKSEHSLWQRF